MGEAYTLNDGHITEAADRLHVAQLTIQASLGDHPLIDAVPALSSQVERIQELLADLYQDVAKYETIKEVKEHHKLTNGYR